MTQNEAVLRYMRQHGAITPMDALRELGVARLAARIRDLRDQGYDISKTLVQVEARTGTTVVASYSLTAALDRDDMGSSEPERPVGLLFDTQKFIAR